MKIIDPMLLIRFGVRNNLKDLVFYHLTAKFLFGLWLQKD